MTPGITLDKWGPAAWNTLHVFAHTAPKRLTAAQRAEWRALLRTFSSFLPCPSCRSHFSAFLQARLTDEALGTRAALVALLNDAHNDVNRRTGKRTFTLDHEGKCKRTLNLQGEDRRQFCGRGMAVWLPCDEVEPPPLERFYVRGEGRGALSRRESAFVVSVRRETRETVLRLSERRTVAPVRARRPLLRGFSGGSAIILLASVCLPARSMFCQRRT